MKQYIVSDNDITKLFQDDIAIQAQNAAEVVTALGNVPFAIVSGLTLNGNTYSAGQVIMNGVLRTVEAGARTTSYLAPLNKGVMPRTTKDGVAKASYTEYATSIVTTPSEQTSPQLSAENVKKYRGYVVTDTIQDGMVTPSKLSPALARNFLFDYVVSDDASLNALATNTTAKNVLILEGTYTLTATINPELTSNIKLIYGSGNVQINTTANRSIYALSDIHNINLTYTGTSYGPGLNPIGFDSCRRLHNCRASGFKRAYTSCQLLYSCHAEKAVNESVGFQGCKNIYDCWADVGYSGSTHTAGYSECSNLSNCVAQPSEENVDGTGFSNCIKLSDCSAVNLAEGYDKCYNLTNCSVTVNTVPAETPIKWVGYNNSHNISNCYCEATFSLPSASSEFYCFSKCKDVHGCRIDPLGDYISGKWIGFSECLSALGNCFNFNSDALPAGIKSFESSYATDTADAAFICADNATGGFNHNKPV